MVSRHESARRIRERRSPSPPENPWRASPTDSIGLGMDSGPASQGSPFQAKRYFQMGEGCDATLWSRAWISCSALSSHPRGLGHRQRFFDHSSADRRWGDPVPTAAGSLACHGKGAGPSCGPSKRHCLPIESGESIRIDPRRSCGRKTRLVGHQVRLAYPQGTT